MFLTAVCAPGSRKKSVFSFDSLEENTAEGLSFYYATPPFRPEEEYSQEAENLAGPTLYKNEKVVCLFSWPSFLWEKEWGPRFRLCFPLSEGENLSYLLSQFYRQKEGKQRSTGELNSRYGKIFYSYFSSSELLNLFREEEGQKALLGDIFLKEKFKKENITGGIYFNQENSSHIETSFASDYFSLFLLKEKAYLILFAREAEFSSYKRHYLAFRFLKDSELYQNISIFLESIKSKNQKLQEECIPDLPVLTEVSISSSSAFSKFIEIQNPFPDKSICLNPLSIKLNDSTVFSQTSGFMLPSAVKLFSDEDSKLNSIHTQSENWKELKTGVTITLANDYAIQEYPIPPEFQDSWEDEYFSYHVNSKDNSKHNPLYPDLSDCMNPGINLMESYDNVCKPEDFQLSEINYSGFYTGKGLSYHDKFLELEYRGEKDCSATQIYLQIDTHKVPFSCRTQTISKGFYTFGRKKYLYSVPQLIERNLIFLKTSSRISLQSKEEERLLFPGFSENEFLLNKDQKGHFHSIIFDNTKYAFHNAYISPLLSPGTLAVHSMSPGEKNPVSSSIHSIQINEVAWMGSYSLEGESLPEEEFLELKGKGPGSIQINIDYSDNRKTYFLVLNEEVFHTIQRSENTCFSIPNSIRDSDFTLPNQKTSISIIDMNTGVLLDSLDYNPSKNEGLNDTSNKIRASFSRTPMDNFHLSSQNPENIGNCGEHFLASPGNDNYFSSFLYTINHMQGLVSPYSLHGQKLNLSVKEYSIAPATDNKYLIPLQHSEFSPILFPIFSYSNSLYYREIDGIDSISYAYSPNIFIDAISPIPLNSQNEWVRICNLQERTVFANQLIIEDTSSPDRLRDFFSVYPDINPLSTQEGFNLQKESLGKGDCAYVLDPDARDVKLPLKGNLPLAVWTVESSKTIGNGLSASENIDLYEEKDGILYHLHSYGNRHSAYPFKLNLSTGKRAILIEGKQGENLNDYMIEEDL